MNLIYELNIFYSRFDVRDTKKECDDFCDTLVPEQVDDVCEEEVKKVFSSIKEGKSAGPDGVHGKLIKRCSEQLAGIFTTIYQMLINLKMFPTSWKLAKIIPVPKTQHARELNDFRPIALTPILAKCFEKIIRKRLLTDVSKSLDPLQFAYKAKRGAEDACITLFNLISNHLEKNKIISPNSFY